MSEHITIHNLNFLYESQSEFLFQDLNLHFGPGWTGIVGKNGSGKSTLAKLIAGELDPHSGTIQGKQSLCYVSQDTYITREVLEDLLYNDSKESGRFKNLLKIRIESPDDYDFLSFGEKRRLLLAVALSESPAVLILDEPTNHLDFESIQIIRNTLSHYQGIGILISHDRSLLDDLATHCIFLEKNFYSQRPGNYSEGKKEMEREAIERTREWEAARFVRKKLEAELTRRREEASLSHKHRSKKGLDLHDHDGRYKKNLARVSGKDGQAGRLKQQLDKRTEHLERKENEIFLRLPENENLGILWKTETSKRKHLFLWEEENFDFGFMKLQVQSHIQILPESKIAITGKNGSGKSTLLKFLVKQLEEKKIPHLYLPQEFSKKEIQSLLWEFQNLQADVKAKVLSGVHRLGSDPKRVFESQSFSPGEIKKIFLSLRLNVNPEILLLDEPTNHLDIKSLEALESSLKALRTALVVVSHDRCFVESIAKEEWSLENLSVTQKHLDRI
ncbi:ATP-binding cassette domain-containing protein [Leptospira vanthielii]|uniref:ABC transporter, ATP-binding protein n=1 Tax=Leptospira vanthielii serovar Holland str. Waz Holland = ATCC 700522 TaxID=1218591 RepID=N1WA73_9LEPT|nr:ATP-binding cassette domain-containing protein [Leptospira vanthielii]EMY70067.1 ABC transporter, ATP-binding protein [Leptospira vanthielii serovar Holland str. Waz Holland = ATCC 700522]